MPFKSEAQRKYLWANEPEIARDWTDTYGSRIQKAGGQLVQPGIGRPGYQGDRPPSVRGREAAQEKAARDTWEQTVGQSYKAPLQAKTITPKDSRDGWIAKGLSYLENKQKKGMTSYFDRNKARYENKLRKIYGTTEDEDLWMAPMDEFSSEEFSPQNLKRIDKYTDKVQEANRIQKEIESGKFTQDDFTARLNKLNPPASPGGEGVQDPWWLNQPAPVASIDDTTTASTGLGGGHFQVPLEYVVGQQRAAEGGIIGSVGGTSRQKYQMGNMVGAEMEGAEMEGAMMQSKEVIKELYDALIAQGLSPQEAMEKIKEIIAATQAERPQAPMMGEEFPGQEFGRAPAAFGGIMDTYTGRRKYGIGSFISKALKKVKKLASSKLGKIALMYAAGTYLAGTTAFGGTGELTFAQRLRDPKILANLINPTGSGVGEGKGWSMFQKAQPALNLSSIDKGFTFPGSTIGNLDKLAPAAKTPWYKNPWVTIPAASAAAGLYTDQEDEPEDISGKWDEDKKWWDNYYANLGSYEGGDYRVPKEYRVAQGGRIGYGLGSWVKSALGLGKKEGRAEADPGVVSTQDPDVMREKLLDYFKAKYSGWEAAQGGRIGRQEGGLMDLGGMEKDYRDDGGFVPLGGEEKADDVPARLSKNEFVFTADAVRNAGGGDIDRGAEVMENVMKNLEGGGKISEESQGQGAQEMFEVSERLSEVV